MLYCIWQACQTSNIVCRKYLKYVQAQICFWNEILVWIQLSCLLFLHSFTISYCFESWSPISSNTDIFTNLYIYAYICMFQTYMFETSKHCFACFTLSLSLCWIAVTLTAYTLRRIMSGLKEDETVRETVKLGSCIDLKQGEIMNNAPFELSLKLLEGAN